MNLKLDMNYISDRLCCTDEEKRECLETVKKIALINTVVRKEGVLAAGFLNLNDDAFLAECVSLITDGIEGKQLEEAYKTLLIAGNYRGREFLKNAVICEGLLAARNDGGSGDSVYMRFFWVSLLFGAGWRKAVFDTLKEETKRVNDAIDLAKKENGSWKNHI